MAKKKPAKKAVAKKAVKKAVKPVAKKAAPKAAKKAKRGRKRGRKAAKVVIRKMGAEGAPSILVVGGAEPTEPIWVRPRALARSLTLAGAAPSRQPPSSVRARSDSVA